MKEGHGVALFFGTRIWSVDPAPFNSVSQIRWRLPDDTVQTTERVRGMYGMEALDIVYAPRRTCIVPFAGIGSSMAATVRDADE